MNKRIDESKHERKRKARAVELVSRIEKLMEELDGLGVKAEFNVNYYPRKKNRS
jgi:hypothetical protein